MKKNFRSTLLFAAAGMLALLPACGTSNDTVTTNVVQTSPTTPLTPPSVVASIFQNPFMSANPGNNIHNDSYLSDSYAYRGPTSAAGAQFSQGDAVAFDDPFTGQPRAFLLGECAGQAFDRDGNIQTIAAGFADRQTGIVQRDIVTLDRNTLKVLAFTSFTKQQTDITDFGGAGYFYQDNQFRMVVALPNGHVQVLRRQKSPVSTVDQYVPDADYNVCGTGGAIAPPPGLTSLTLYALMPDKAGNIWWTTGEGVIGTITPSGVIRGYDVNAPGGSGLRVPQSDGQFEAIANSHASDEGDSNSEASGVYILTTYNLYRFGASADGAPQLVWKAPYDHGTQQKPGQVSFGSGTSPTVFKMGNRRFVTIADNAQFMNINVYRAEAKLQPGEQRLFAQGAPFGTNPLVSDENSLIVAPALEGGTNIYAENNYGYLGPASTRGTNTTEPGFARMRLSSDGGFAVASVNNQVRVPTIVSKVSIPSQTIYTWEHQPTGWYVTGLDANDLNTVRFTALAGPGPEFNNHYSALSLDADGRTLYLGTIFGLTKVVLSP